MGEQSPAAAGIDGVLFEDCILNVNVWGVYHYKEKAVPNDVAFPARDFTTAIVPPPSNVIGECTSISCRYQKLPFRNALVYAIKMIGLF